MFCFLSSAAGTEAAPLKTPQAAIDKAASTKADSVVMRGGTYYLTAALSMTSKHNGISVSAYKGESPVLSGGKELKTEWKPYDVSNSSATWSQLVGDNIVFDSKADGKTIIDLGKTDDANACLALCKKNSRYSDGKSS